MFETNYNDFGICFPRLYGLSSLQSLHEKMQRIDVNENMQKFESRSSIIHQKT